MHCTFSSNQQMLRSRLQEHFERVVREDMLTLFNCTASLKSLECSMVLQGTAQMSSEVKYRAACILEILTGQRPHATSCSVEEEDPLYVKRSGEEQRALERLKSAMIHRANRGASAADYRAVGNGTLLKTTLRRVPMYDFLEKAREFYLPDVLLLKASTADKSSGASTRSSILSATVADGTRDAYFAAWNRTKLPQHPRLVPPRPDDTALNTVFLLKSSDLLKFPDIELHFEALGSAFASSHAGSDDTLQLVLRPTLQANYPLGQRSQTAVFSPVSHQGVFNYLLCKFFNPYITRPQFNLKGSS